MLLLGVINHSAVVMQRELKRKNVHQLSVVVLNLAPSGKIVHPERTNKTKLQFLDRWNRWCSTLLRVQFVSVIRCQTISILKIFNKKICVPILIRNVSSTSSRFPNTTEAPQSTVQLVERNAWMSVYRYARDAPALQIPITPPRAVGAPSGSR